VEQKLKKLLGTHRQRYAEDI